MSGDDELPAAKHREAAQFVEHIGQLASFAVEVGALRISGKLAKNFFEMLQLKKRIRTEQCVDRLGHADASNDDDCGRQIEWSCAEIRSASRKPE